MVIAIRSCSFVVLISSWLYIRICIVSRAIRYVVVSLHYELGFVGSNFFMGMHVNLFGLVVDVPWSSEILN